MNLDRFVNHQNLKRFRPLASQVTSKSKRKILLELSARNQVKSIELQNAADALA
jgi:hypothetical protein